MSIELFKGQESFSIYLHVPFCKVKCRYCDFYSEKSNKGSAEYLEALEREVFLLLQQNPYLQLLPVSTIFIGGGTPSVLTNNEWQRVAAVLHQFNLDLLTEWTIECNPESFTDEKAELYLEAGVNRISFGIQSLNDKELQVIGRAHSAQRVHEVLGMGILDAFDAISGDLIYGLPSQSLQSLETTVRELTAYKNLKHISAYELTVAEGTPLAENLHRYVLPSDDELVIIHRRVKELLRDTGFIQYEVSNYAKRGFESKHNSAYWLRKPYLGLGPAAHSFDGRYRFSNGASLREYCKCLLRGELAHNGYESVTKIDALAEFLFLRLRMNAGFSEADFMEEFSEPFVNGVRERIIGELVTEGMLCVQKGSWACSEKGLDMVDAIALRLLDE